jgi:predicted ATP-grasp superfamily ATP-dependent carboligase
LSDIIIAAASARAFVRAAAAAGRRVIAADVFLDRDTRAAAAGTLRLIYADGGFCADDVRAQIFPLLEQGAELVYGSGFETQPELLEALAHHGKVWGNSADKVRLLKSPATFFALLSSPKIPFPAWSSTPPENLEGWLCKRIGGSGGTHIFPAAHCADPMCYYQKKTAGTPVSLLFLADGKNVMPVGYNRQLLAPSSSMPYRYGGVVSGADLALHVRDGMLKAAAEIAWSSGLCGLNSLDCMVDEHGFQVLEINPRLSATFALYDAANAGAVLFEAHMQACAGVLLQALPPEQPQAHLIYYAPSDFMVSAAMEWPDWVADVPESGTVCKAEEPLCTVMASADNADAALALASARMAALGTNLNQVPKKSQALEKS